MLKIPFLFGRTSRRVLSFLGELCHIPTHFAAVFLAVVIILMGTGSLAASVTGLVGDWPFDEEVGTTATDFSGFENAGTLTDGPTYTFGKFGYGLSLDGIDDHVAIPHSESLDVSTELTVSTWVYNHMSENSLLSDAEYHIVASKGWAAAPGGSWTLAWDKKTNEIVFMVRKSSDTGYLQVSFNAGNLIDDWHLITAVLSSGKASLYVDGLLVAGPISLGTAAINRNTKDLRVGSVEPTSDGAVYNWQGGIDEFQIYSRALAEAEIQALYEGAATPAESFDFILSNSGDVTVTRGAAVLTSVNATALSGIPGDVAFQVSGLPAGAKASLSLKKCKPGCSAILTIKTKPSTAPGNYLLTVTGQTESAGLKAVGAAGGSGQSTSFTLAVVAPKTATPQISPNGGTYGSAVSVSLKSATSGAAIHYTLDGTPPTQSSPKYKRPFSLSSDAVVKAKAFKKGYNPSEEASALFTKEKPFDFSLFNSGNKAVSAGGSIDNSINATLSSTSSEPISFSVTGLPWGATASFSSATCSPSCSSTLTVITSGSTPAGTSTITVNATGGGVTKTTTFSLTVSLPTVATPSISPNGGNYTGSVSVSIQTATTGSSVYYTTDGSTPTQSSAPYTGAITLATSAVVKAKAFKAGYNPSGEVSASFTVSAPKFTLTWQDNSTNEDNFQIERKTGSGSYAAVATVAANVNSYVDAAVVSGITYCYRVRAANSAGTSSYTNEACSVAS
ncbi:MAG: chitobiase/beta-hexosaminidase C-terminal domain-containing protein [Candidatus Binatia bacterium]